MSDLINKPSKINRKPDLLCIGAQKAGTTWLHEVMAQHPDVWVPPFKEVHFFDHKFTPNNHRWTTWHIDKSVRAARKSYIHNNQVLNRDYLLYLESIQERPLFNGNWYKNVFSVAPPNQLALDVTPEYSCINEDGMNFIAKFLPKAKFIYIIRDPFARAVSQLRMQVQNRNYIPNTPEEWDEFLKISEVFSRADYATYVPQWDRTFGDRVLYLPFGRIKSDPGALCKQIESFSGLGTFDYNFKGPVHETDKKINFPDQILSILKTKNLNQYSFLEERFGENFCMEIL